MVARKDELARRKAAREEAAFVVPTVLYYFTFVFAIVFALYLDLG